MTEVRENKEALENKQRSYDRTFKTVYTTAHQQKEKEKRKPQKAN